MKNTKHIRKLFLFCFILIFPETELQAQYQLDWLKLVNNYYFKPYNFYYNNQDNRLYTTSTGWLVYDEDSIKSIGRTLPFCNQPFTVPYMISIESTTGKLYSKLIGEDMRWGFTIHGHNDTLSIFKKICKTNSPSGIDTFTMQINDIYENRTRKFIPVQMFGKIDPHNPQRILSEEIIRSNDLEHFYYIFLVQNTDSIILEGKTIPTDSLKYNYILCRFRNDGKLDFAFNIFSCKMLATQGLGTLTEAYYFLDESGTGYFTGFVWGYDAWILGDFYKRYHNYSSFLVRFSPDGKFLNKKFFNAKEEFQSHFYFIPRFTGKFYFYGNINFSTIPKYQYNELGYHFDGSAIYEWYTSYPRGYVIGEMDTGFNVLWYRILPKRHSSTNLIKFHQMASENTNGFINDKNELIMFGFRNGPIVIDTNTMLFDNNTLGSIRPFVMSVSKEKGFRVLYEYGYNLPRPDEVPKGGIGGWTIGFSQVNGSEIFAVFKPLSEWGIEDYYWKHEDMISDPFFYYNQYLFVKISQHYREPDSMDANVQCMSVSAEVIYGGPQPDSVFFLHRKRHLIAPYYGSPDSVIWHWGDGTITKSYETASHEYKEAGIYTITAYSWLNDTLWTGTYNVDVPGFSMINVETQTYDTFVVFEIKNAPGGSVIVWDDGDTSFIKTVFEERWYSYTLITSDNCKIQDSIFADFLLSGVKDQVFDLDILNIFPNPASNILYIEYEYSGKRQFFNIQINDLSGKTILTTDINARQGKNKEQIDLQNMLNGIYLVTISNDERSVTKKIEIVR